MSVKKTNKQEIQISEIADMTSCDAMVEEVKNIFIRSYDISDFKQFRELYRDLLLLNRGELKGFNQENTPYFDAVRSVSAALAYARLAEAYRLKNKKISLKNFTLGFISSLYYSSGYLQKDCNSQGIKDKHALPTIDVSIDFLKKYMKLKKYTDKDIVYVCNILKLTDMQQSIGSLKIPGSINRTVACLSATAVIVSNMAERTYLEGLVFSYDEIRAAKIIQKKSVAEILIKAIEYYRKRIIKKLDEDLGSSYTMYVYYFKEHYSLNRNLYMEAIEKQISYLANILRENPNDYIKRLKRRKPVRYK